MPCIKYRNHRFFGPTRAVVDFANQILTEETTAGYTLSLRQLYYRFVAAGRIANTEKEYKRLGRIMTAARESGLTDWTALEDRGRGSLHYPILETTEGVLEGIARKLCLDMWKPQGIYVEVWVEKQALEQVVSRPCGRWRAPYMACKGYLSASESWRAGVRFAEAARWANRLVLLHLADHDPSGLDMTRDNSDRLDLFGEQCSAEVRRIALNIDQVRAFNPPPNPTKITDSRAPGYLRLYGRESWELDALPPAEIDRLIGSELEGLVDRKVWDETLKKEQDLRAPLRTLPQRWTEVRDLLARNEGALEKLDHRADGFEGALGLLQVIRDEVLVQQPQEDVDRYLREIADLEQLAGEC